MKPILYTDNMIQDYTDKGYWKDVTYADLYQQCAEKYPNKEALVDSEKRLTWSEANLQANRIALKFVEREYLQNKLKEQPIMLLDDVFGELDEKRVKHLVHHIQNDGQSFITTTIRDKFQSSEMPDIHFIQMQNGAALN